MASNLIPSLAKYSSVLLMPRPPRLVVEASLIEAPSASRPGCTPESCMCSRTNRIRSSRLRVVSWPVPLSLCVNEKRELIINDPEHTFITIPFSLNVGLLCLIFYLAVP